MNQPTPESKEWEKEFERLFSPYNNSEGYSDEEEKYYALLISFIRTKRQLWIERGRKERFDEGFTAGLKKAEEIQNLRKHEIIST